jgi:hypothetical protein
MRLRNLLTVLLAVLVFSASALLAEEKAEKKMKLEGLAYINWHTMMTDSTDNEGGEKENTFQLERVYLTWKSSFANGWSARVTTDVENKRSYEEVELEINDDVDDGGNGDGIVDADEVDFTAKSKTKYVLFLKYAYVEKKSEIGPARLQFRFGLIDTPIIGFIDKLIDQRWIHRDFIDDAKDILIMSDGKGYELDYSADMGASLGIELMKMVEVHVAVTNGEGYKNSLESEDDARNEGKAYYGRLTVSPIPQLKISGYYRREGLDADESDFHKGYYGGGIAWVDKKLIMIGANYVVAYEKEAGDDLEGTQVDGTDKKYEFSIIDAWVTVKFDTIVGVPLFLVGRYGIGDTGHKEGKTTYMGAGLGYQFDPHVRFIAYYDQFDNELADYGDEPNPSAKFSIKCEVKI